MNIDPDEREARIAELEARLAEAEETLQAIRQGEVDALVVTGPAGDQVFTLKSAETPYRFLVEEMNEGALLVSSEGMVLYANARFAALAGLPLEGIIGSEWELSFSPAERPRLRALLETRARGGAKAEFHLLASDGSARPVEVSLAQLKRDSLEGFSVVVADLSERKAAERALRVSNARLRELVGELEQFSYSISHDMRAPLRAMKSFAEIMSAQCDSCEQKDNRDLLRRISLAAGRLDGLVQGALDYSRVIKEELALRPVALGTLVRGLLETYPNLLAGNAHIAIRGELPVVLGHEAALTQVFSNLLGNAVKFVSPGTRPLVRIWAEPKSGGQSGESTAHKPQQPGTTVPSTRNPPLSTDLVRVWVEDNGIGIPAPAQRRIFDLFHRAHKEYEGTGIGLAVVRKFVERMGGSVGVESSPGHGSRFWIQLRTAANSSKAQ